jgi:hypothetical protein
MMGSFHVAYSFSSAFFSLSIVDFLSRSPRIAAFTRFLLTVVRKNSVRAAER